MILCDIDGVITCNEKQTSFVEWEEGIMYMKPNEAVIEFVRPHLRDVVFVTARGEQHRAATIAWFQIHFPEAIEKSIDFRFRNNGDTRKSHEIKRDIVGDLIFQYGRKITMAIDDIGDNVVMFRAMGITTMQCLTPGAVDNDRDPHNAE